MKRESDQHLESQQSRKDHASTFKIDFDDLKREQLKNTYLALNPFLDVSKNIIKLFELYQEIDKHIDTYNQKNAQDAQIMTIHESDDPDLEYVNAQRRISRRKRELQPLISQFETLFRDINADLNKTSTHQTVITDQQEIKDIFMFPTISTRTNVLIKSYKNRNPQDRDAAMIDEKLIS